VLLTPVVVAGMSADVKRLVTRHSVMARLDTDGKFTVAVLASDDPDWMVDGPVLYQVAEYIAGARGKGYQVHIPGPGPVDLADLQPVDEPQTVAPYPVPGAAGAPGARGPAGPAGPQGPIGAGIRILSAVPTVGDLPSTGNQPGDAHLVTATGNLHVWDGSGWTEIGHVQGPPGPAGPLDMLTDVTAPADTQAGLTLGTTGVGAWGPVSGSKVAIDAANSIAGMVRSAYGVQQWSARAYPSQVAVYKQDAGVFAVYTALQDTAATDVPGTSAKWQRLILTTGTLDGLTDVAAPADTPANRILGTTAVGTWGPVPNPVPSIAPPDDGKVLTVSGTSTVWADPPESLPPAVATVGYDWTYNGSGNATAPGDLKVNTTSSPPTSLRINLLDRSGADRAAWLTAITAGTVITLTQSATTATFTVSGTPSTAGSGTGAFRSMSGTWGGAPISAFLGPNVLVTVSVQAAAPDGSVLSLAAGQPAWAAPPAPGMTQAQADARYLGLGGGTLTGALSLPAFPPPLDAHAISKVYADTHYWKFWSGTQAQYDALPTKDVHTLYAITG
jgi:hypothetical protein